MVIETQKEYQSAIRQINDLLDIENDTSDAEMVNSIMELAEAISSYEDKLEKGTHESV